MKNPKRIIPRVEKVFQIFCLCMASYWIALFSAQYVENRDAIYISMKTFNENPIDKYPTFTLCFGGDNFHWYRENNIFDAYGINSTQYELMLMGEKAMTDKLNKTSKLYEKHPVFLSDFDDTNFDHFSLRTSDFVHELNFFTKERSNDVNIIGSNVDNETLDSNFHLSYQTANKICFTRNSNDVLKTTRSYDLITFNSSVIGHERYKNADIQVFIHAPDQLVKSLYKPKYESSLSHFTSTLKTTSSKGPKILEFKISQVQQLRKRFDSNTPCNVDVSDYDRYYKQQISQRLGCVPPYWWKMVSDDSQLKQCITPTKLADAHRIINDPKSDFNLTEFPCTEMNLLGIDSINYEPDPQPRDTSIAFIYTEKTYEEITYSRMMGFDGWLSNVGGFIGIFLGYSMMQAPELLIFVIDFFRAKT